MTVVGDEIATPLVKLGSRNDEVMGLLKAFPFAITNSMNKEFFVRLTLAAYRVAERMPGDENAPRIRNAATKVLSDLMIIWDQNPVTPPQKAQVIPRALQEISQLQIILKEASSKETLGIENFDILGREYKRVEGVLRHSLLRWQEKNQEQLADPLNSHITEKPAPSPALSPLEPAPVKREESIRPIRSQEHALSDRQQKILDTLQSKDKIQVWELQKIFPHVTKRTLRRDMDDLLQYRLVEKLGEWNEVAYRKPSSGSPLSRG